MKKYVVLHKAVGQTPLQCAEAWRQSAGAQYAQIPLSYAGRLDPMASGKLLVLIGEECKRQEIYHGLDKRYEFSVLLGVASDTGDVLGRLNISNQVPTVTPTDLQSAARKFTGPITLPYPHFSAKTVKGKPLHTWTLEGRLHEIDIPTQSSRVFSLELQTTQQLTRAQIYHAVSQKIETILPVTEARKALGNDFRRVDVRADWKIFVETGEPTDIFSIATFACVASSGTYMRSLAEEISKTVHTSGLAYHIHRTHIGHYQPLPFGFGFWRSSF